MALFGMTFIVQAVKVPTGSMENTITIGDHLLVNKFIFAPGKSLPFPAAARDSARRHHRLQIPRQQIQSESDYERSDNKPIVTNYVKRVIGVPGDHIQIEGHNVIVNGKVLPEHRIEAVDNNDKGPVEIKDAPPRKADRGQKRARRREVTMGHAARACATAVSDSINARGVERSRPVSQPASSAEMVNGVARRLC